MAPLSPDDLHRIFKNLDKNGEGVASIYELKQLLDKVGIQTSLEELEKLVGKTSLDYIDFFFFYEAIIKPKISDDSKILDKDLLEAFKVFDLNGDGVISSEELQSVLIRLGLWDKQNNDTDCKSMINMYDTNLDGVLDFQEFKNMMSFSSTSDA